MLEYFKHEYENACKNQSDINEHIPILFDYANKVSHITELGVRWGVSTRAFLYSAVLNKTTLCSYDINLYDVVKELFAKASEINTNLSYQQANTLDLIIEETDLLFIDTLHTYQQLSTELKLHGNKAKKYIIFHDTVTFFELNKAIDEFCEANKHWKLLCNYTNNNGLKILERY